MRVAFVCPWTVAMAAVVWTGGCRYVLTTTPAFSEKSGIRWIDPNDAPFVVVEPDAVAPNASGVAKWRPIRITTGASTGQPYQVRADALRFHVSGNTYIPLTMPGGRKYWALVDTGFAHYFYVNDILVRECDLAVYPLGGNRATRAPTGLCEIPALRLGQVIIESPPWSWTFARIGSGSAGSDPSCRPATNPHDAIEPAGPRAIAGSGTIYPKTSVSASATADGKQRYPG